MHIMESSKELRTGHYYLALPFKDDNVTMPNNYQQAQQRAMTLRRKFERNEQYHKEYTAFIEAVIEKGHGEMVGVGNTKWNEVVHPTSWSASSKKGSLRVVFDG